MSVARVCVCVFEMGRDWGGGSGGPTAALSLSEFGAALLFAVVVKLTLPVHHVGGPAVKLHLPLTLGLVDVV